MAFTVEDGTGVAGANAYITVAFLRAYFSERGITFAESDSAIQPWIVQATDYIELTFGSRLVGAPLTATQGLHFPVSDGVTRQGVVIAEDEIPLSLQRACAEYGKRAKTNSLLPDPDVDANGLVRVTTKEKVGEIEVEYEKGKLQSSYTMSRFPNIDFRMLDLLRPVSAGVIR